MLKEGLNLKVKGHVTIYKDGETIFDRKNNIDPTTAPALIARSLGSSFSVTHLKIMNNGTTLVIQGNPQLSYNDINGTIRYRWVFPEESFSGTFNQIEIVREGNPLEGDRLAYIHNLDPVEKTPDNQLILEWSLTVEII